MRDRHEWEGPAVFWSGCAALATAIVVCATIYCCAPAGPTCDELFDDCNQRCYYEHSAAEACYRECAEHMAECQGESDADAYPGL